MATLKRQFPDIVFRKLTPPAEHPTYEYDGFNPSVQTLPKGHTRKPGLRPFGIDTVFEKDVAVKLRDGVTIYTDVFRPTSSSEEDGKVPAVIPWSPYGKSGRGSFNYDNMGPFRMGLALDQTSGYEKFEAPDPAEWAERGYAIVNVDPRGAGDSEGEIAFWGQQEAEDMYDFVDWVAAQPWCSGSVAFAGNSWLAVSQINFASRFKHPAVKALAPWEGLSDLYRQQFVRGGVPRVEFFDLVTQGFAGHGRTEDLKAMYHKHPIFDEYWEDKAIKVENIDVPLYLTASYSTGLHSEGSFHTFMKAKSQQKWLRVHASQEWHDIYRPDVNDELQQFFDHYCKGINNGWEKTPAFRISLLGFTGSPAKTIVERAEDAWPIPLTEEVKYYLDSATKTLSPTAPTTEASASYSAHSATDCLDFTHTFAAYTELAGYPVAKVCISFANPNVTDVHVQIRKKSRSGTLLASLNFPVPIPERDVPDTNVAKFLGPEGMLRAGCAGTKTLCNGRVAYALDRAAEPVPVDQVLQLEIPIWPLGMVFEAGEGVVLRVAGRELRLPELEGLERGSGGEEGESARCTLHTGGRWQSWVLLPVIP
ncbi:uncharacterized protein K452DRAFT_114106 [Aplosporella prunicola CBS 121167]|uniref:Xaa-Pro dipeptidyl-peptidase C-terminal domain-containing protein n=1 Tax=Aplosporella prunicola CBS 121167 TaxID=1176127 RepID=A0A6A6B1E5_9PEZI|nr:uncharacterized protein K452DRAFT_114106 [Aplosporella prunicola CBS 121167]KAF2137085.1 hypothetical protein K452DRAFT_114106 [Aplosporella prunicola CBS 121167]